MQLNSTAKKFLGNSGWMMAQQVYSMILFLVVGALSARYLGPKNYGLINYAASIIMFFTILCRLGLDSTMVNEMIAKPDKQNELLSSALFMRLVVSVISQGLIYLIIIILDSDNQALHIVTMLQSIAIIFQVYEVLTYYFQLKLRMKYVSIATMIAQTVVAGWRIFLLANKASVNFFALSQTIQYAVCGVVVLIFFLRETKFHFAPQKELAFNLISKSYHFIISGLAVTFYLQIDKVMIGKILSEEQVGIYTAATTIAAMWEFVPTALVNSARPLIIELRKTSKEAYIKRFQQLLLAITGLSVIVSIGIMVLGWLAIRILYGKAYMGAVLPLSILVWSTGFAMIGTARSIWIVAEGLNKYSKYYVLIGSVVNFVLNLYFIRRWGIVGASITTLISQITVAFISPLFFSKSREFNFIYFSSFRQIGELAQKTKTILKKEQS